MINSISNPPQIYATNKVAKTTAISAYSDISSAKPLSRMEQMQEKYKDIYVPMPAHYSKENEDSINKLLAEKYPNLQEEINKTYVTGSENGNGDRLLKNNVYLFGNKELQQEFFDYREEVSQIYPQNIWDRPGYPVSNSKELATFYNAAVYESLEEGKDLQTATILAGNVTSSFMDDNEFVDNLTKMLYKAIGESEPVFTDDGLLKYHQNKSFDIDLSSYGFSFDSAPKNQYDETSMVNYISNKIKEYEFILTNPSIVENAFQNLDSSYIRDRNVQDTIINPIQEYKLPNAKLALSIYSKYKIFDSIDIKA